MYYLTIFLAILPTAVLGMVIDVQKSKDASKENDSKISSIEVSTPSFNHLSDSIHGADAQESTNFFSNINPLPFSARSSFDGHEYESLFDTFPNLPYFPDFGEIFRIQKSTTQSPPLRFPDFIRDAFPERPDTSAKPPRDSIAGGRRPARRPPRPASSGTKAKLAKQNQSEPKEKVKPGKAKPTTKAKDYAKIFRFTSDRVNLADFDMRKKMNGNYKTLAKGDELDSSKIQRNHFLILHGGVFEIDRPVNNGLYLSGSDIVPVTETAAIAEEDLVFGSRIDKPNRQS